MPDGFMVWTDPATKKRYKVRYEGDVPPDEQSIREQTGTAKVKVHEYRHPDDGKTYRVKYTGELPPSGEDIIKAAKPVRTRNAVKNAVKATANVAGRFLMGAVGGTGYANLAPMKTDKRGRVLPPAKRGAVEGGVAGGRDPLNIVLSPVAVPAMKVAAKVTNAPRNFAQGATAPGLARFDSLVAAGQDPDAATMAKALFTDIPGNVKAGARAAIRDDGDKRIGKEVPELSPNTLTGAVYNALTAAGSDPLNLVGAGAPKLAGAAVRLANKTRAGRKAVAVAGALRAASEPGAVTNAVVRTSKVPGVRADLPEGSTVRPLPGGRSRAFSPEAAAARDRIADVVNSSVPVNRSKNLSASPTLGRATRKARVSAPGVSGVSPSPARAIAQRVANTALSAYSEADGLMRGLSYGGDQSAALRQGAILGLTRPKTAGRAVIEQARAYTSPRAYEGQLKAIAARNTAGLHQDFGLYVPRIEAVKAGDVLRREEAFVGSKLAEKLPVVKQVIGAGDRAMTAYLTRLRADVFDDTMKAWSKSGITPDNSPDEYRALAEWVNTATGRGKLGKLEPYAGTLSKVFASPRLQSSRLSVINPLTYARMPPAARRIALRDALSFAGANAALLTLAGVAGEANKDGGISAVADLRSGDFGKVILGKTRLDLSAGVSPWVRMIAQASTGGKVTSGGTEKQVPPGETAARFARGRLAPLPSLILDAVTGKTFAGDDFDPESAAVQRFVPLFAQDLVDAVAEQGTVPGSLLGLAAFYGAGVQTYGEGERRNGTVRQRQRKPSADAVQNVARAVQRAMKASKKGSPHETDYRAR
ncbi:MAG: hypothetical protein H8F28_06440 [Fibrella sp.]|nr:hypothetical protein [Armatimonadota bacterium]